nr:hypothetical protein [Arthrobacter sp. Marseille-P9274]
MSTGTLASLSPNTASPGLQTTLPHATAEPFIPGPCLNVTRAALDDHAGNASAKTKFAEDVTEARAAGVAAGVDDKQVAFLRIIESTFT